MNRWTQKPLLGSQIDWDHPLSSGLVGCWLMNEGAGGRINDLTINNQYGTLVNNALWVPGRKGPALMFDGASTGAYANVGLGSALNISGPNITIISSIYPTGWGGGSKGRIFAKLGSGTGYNFFIDNGNTTAGFTFSKDGGTGTGGSLQTSGANALVLNRWQQIAFTWAGGSTATFYVNGSVFRSNAALTGTITASPAIVASIGKDTSTADRRFAGLIDDIRVYKRALTSQEIAQIYEAPYDFIWQPKKYWLYPQGTIDASLAVSGAGHTVAATDVFLAENKTISIANTSHSLSSVNVSLAGDTELEVLANSHVVNSANATLTQQYVFGSLGKSADGWAGAVPVYMTLQGGLSNNDYPYARAITITAAGDNITTPLLWSTARSRYEGTIYPGSNLGLGCADPTTGTFSVSVQLGNNPDFSSIAYSAFAGTFDTFITRRYGSPGDVNPTTYVPTYSVDHWHYIINDLWINAASDQSNVAIALPFHPVTAQISNINITFNGVSVSQGSCTSTSDAWWWDENTHVLYIQKAVLGATYVLVDISFDSDTDLFATRIDRYLTGHIGERLYYNGLVISNQYISTQMFGGGHEGCGEQVDLQGDSGILGLDCMERVAVYVDDLLNPDTTTYYKHNIKWKQTEWPVFIHAESNDSIVLLNNSDSTASTGWKPQLDNGIAVRRTQTYYAGKRYIKNIYDLTNGGIASHKYSIVWGREQWLDPSKQLYDRGRFYGDTSDRSIECSIALSTLNHPWMVSYDASSFGAMGLIFPLWDRPDTGYFLTEAPISTSSAEWPITVTDKGSTEASQTFFSRNYSSVSPGTSVSLTFWQWGGDFVSWSDINTAIDTDYLEINPIITLALINAQHAESSDNVVLKQSQTVAVDNAAHAVATDDPALAQDHHLTINDAVHAAASSNLNLPSFDAITVQNTGHAVNSATPVLIPEYTLIIQHSGNHVLSDGVVLTQSHYLQLANALHSVLSDDIDRIVPPILEVGEQILSLTSDDVSLYQFIYTPIPVVDPIFIAALVDILNSPLGIDAVYTPLTGVAKNIRILFHQESMSDLGMVLNQISMEALTTEMYAALPGELVNIGGAAYKILAPPHIGDDGMSIIELTLE